MAVVFFFVHTVLQLRLWFGQGSLELGPVSATTVICGNCVISRPSETALTLGRKPSNAH